MNINEEFERLLSIQESFREHLMRDNILIERIKNEITFIESEINKDIVEYDLYEKVKILLKNTSENARNMAIQILEKMVSVGLRNIFQNDMDFNINYKETRGKPGVEFSIIENKNEAFTESDPENQHGGGIVDIVSLMLRFAVIESLRDKISGPVILDEPAKFVSEDYIYNVSEFINKISSEYNRQIIMVTHNKHLSNIGDKTYIVFKENGKSYVEEN